MAEDAAPEAGLRAAIEAPTDSGGAYLPVCQPCIDGVGSECHTPGCAFWMRDVPRDGANGDIALPAGETIDGLANDCPHLSATGVDTAPIGPGKVWRCDHCGLTYVDGGSGRRAALAAARTQPEAADDWPCDNYTEPHTCLSVGCSETAVCRICRIRAADRIIADLRKPEAADDTLARCIDGGIQRGEPEAPAARAEVRLTDDERGAILDTLADTAGRSYGPDAILRQVERILAARAAPEAGLAAAIEAIEALYPPINYELRYDDSEDPTAAAYVDAFREVDRALEPFRAALAAARTQPEAADDTLAGARRLVRRGICSCGEVQKENRLGHADGCRYFSDSVYEAADDTRTFTAEEVIEIANETSDSLGNLYRLDFIDRIKHEARVIPPGTANE